MSLSYRAFLEFCGCVSIDQAITLMGRAQVLRVLCRADWLQTLSARAFQNGFREPYARGELKFLESKLSDVDVQVWVGTSRPFPLDILISFPLYPLFFTLLATLSLSISIPTVLISLLEMGVFRCATFSLFNHRKL